MDITNDANAVAAPAAEDQAAPADDPSHSPGSPQLPTPLDPEAVRHR
ncbi:hypothetical protein [Isoptericola sp. NPDC057391]